MLRISLLALIFASFVTNNFAAHQAIKSMRGTLAVAEQDKIIAETMQQLGWQEDEAHKLSIENHRRWYLDNLQRLSLGLPLQKGVSQKLIRHDGALEFHHENQYFKKVDDRNQLIKNYMRQGMVAADAKFWTCVYTLPILFVVYLVHANGTALKNVDAATTLRFMQQVDLKSLLSFISFFIGMPIYYAHKNYEAYHAALAEQNKCDVALKHLDEEQHQRLEAEQASEKAGKKIPVNYYGQDWRLTEVIQYC